MVNLITEHIDIWTAAQTQKNNGGRGRGKNSNGQSPHGIKKLRELILELAVRGKLAPQDPTDLPASVLLEKIAKNKARLIKEGKIKKQKPLLEITEEEKPFDLPKGWAWTRLGNISYKITDGSHHTPTYVSEGIPFLSVKDMSSGYLDFSKTRFISKEQHEELIKRCHPERGDLLLTKVGTTGIPVLIETDKSFSIFVSVALIKFAQNQVSGRFLSLLVKSPLVNVQSKKGTEGIGNKNLVLRKIMAFLIAIPPLNEQHRIVAKVDELMALCDQLEQQQTDSNAIHQTLLETLLATLTDTADQKEFTKAWQRIANHFDILFTTEQSIDQLKQTILQLAVMGKLVPQDPNNEPASVLIEKIAKEKARLIKENKIKKQKPLPEISEEERPFKLPEGWNFVRLVALSKLITKGSSPKWQGVAYTEDTEDILFVTSENVGSYVLKLDSRKYVEKKFNEVEPRSILQKGDFLMNIVGASIGRTAIYNIDDLANINQAVCLIRVFLQFLDSQYLLHFFNSEICVSYMFDKQVDNARANLSMGNIAKFVIPFPPLAEQRRIVAIIDELMTLCDTLKARLNDAQTTQVQLADAIVEHAAA